MTYNPLRPGGRPINQDRQHAIDLGLKTYIGAKHVKCGTDVRYVSGGGCVHCARIIATEQREARKWMQAQAALDNTEEMVHEEPETEIDNVVEEDADARFQDSDDLM